MLWLTPDTSQACHGDLSRDADSVMCGSAGYVLKECFCLPFRATLRKLRPEDMFETWVSTCGGNHCVPCQLATRSCCSRALASGWAKHYLSFFAKLLPHFWEKGKALAAMPSASVETGCSNALCSSNGELGWLLLASQKEEGKLSSVPGRCGACVVILSKVLHLS